MAEIAVTAAIYILSAVVAYQMRPEMPKQQRQNKTINTRSQQEILRLVYGECLVGGNDVFIEEIDGDIWVVQTLSEGECDSVSTDVDGDIIYFNDKRIQDYSSYEDHYFVSGTSSQTVQSNLNAAVPAWTSRLKNVSYIVFKLTYNRELYYSLPTRQILLKGRKLYDPRITNTVYSNNPALELYDFFTNSRYGLGKSSDDIEIDSWKDAMTYCDNNNMTCNIAFDEKDTIKKIIDTILSYFRGALIFNGGKFSLLYTDTTEESSVMTVDDSMIIQSDNGIAQVSISQPSIFDKIDGLTVAFTDPDIGYKRNEIIIGDDSGVFDEIDLTGINDKEEAGKLATYYLERRTLDRTINVLCNDITQQLLAHDLITFTCSAMGISAQLMRVIKSSILHNGNVKLSLVYESDDLYNQTFDAVEEGTYTCNLPNPNGYPSEVENVTFSEELYNLKDRTYTRLKVTWDEPSTYPYVDRVEVWVSTDDITYTHHTTGTDGAFIAPVEVGETWYVKLLPISIWKVKLPIGSATKNTHVITGKTSVTVSDVTNFNILVAGDTLHLSWDKITDQDIVGYEIRYGVAWEISIPIFLVDANSKTIIGMKPGNHTFLIKAKDSLGNYSTNYLYKYITVIGPPSYSQVYSYTEDFTTGTFSNTELDGGYLQVDRGGIDNLSGYWESTIKEPDPGNSVSVRWWTLYSLNFEGASTITWSDIFSGADTWTDKLESEMAWAQLFNMNETGDIDMTIYWSDDQVTWYSATLFEILSMEVTARYIKFRIYLEDYSTSKRIKVEAGLLLKGYFWS